jgi:hypothetical protein
VVSFEYSTILQALQSPKRFLLRFGEGQIAGFGKSGFMAGKAKHLDMLG